MKSSFKRNTLLAALLLAAAAAQATEFAHVTIRKEYYWLGLQQQEKRFYTVDVTVAPDGSNAGLPGAFYTAFYGKQDLYASWVKGQGWTGWNGGVVTPTEWFDITPDARTYRVLADVEETAMCAMAHNKDFEIWAGYGVLDAPRAEAVEAFKSMVSPRITYQHLQRVFAQDNGRKNEQYAKVWSFNCTTIGHLGF